MVKKKIGPSQLQISNYELQKSVLCNDELYYDKLLDVIKNFVMKKFIVTNFVVMNFVVTGFVMTYSVMMKFGIC